MCCMKEKGDEKLDEFDGEFSRFDEECSHPYANAIVTINRAC